MALWEMGPPPLSSGWTRPLGGWTEEVSVGGGACCAPGGDGVFVGVCGGRGGSEGGDRHSGRPAGQVEVSGRWLPIHLGTEGRTTLRGRACVELLSPSPETV